MKDSDDLEPFPHIDVDLARRPAPFVRLSAPDRLRLIDLFVWTTAIAACLAGERWLQLLAPYKLGASGQLWLAVTVGTALCVWPWLVSRAGRGGRSPLLPGERLWMQLGVLVPLGVLFLFGDAPHGVAGLSVFALATGAFCAMWMRQPLRWRFACGGLSIPWFIVLLSFVGLSFLESGDAGSAAREVSFEAVSRCIQGDAALWMASVVAIPFAGDVVSGDRGRFRWSHYVGGLTLLSWLGMAYLLYDHSPNVYR